MALAIGIIAETDYRELDTIRKIRNEFAHSVEVSFKSPKIWDLANQLLLESPTLLEVNPEPRAKFIMCAGWLSLVLESRIPELIEQRLFFQEWSGEPIAEELPSQVNSNDAQ
jgi:hypothetical protein